MLCQYDLILEEEMATDELADNYNSSVSTPLASRSGYSWWVYAKGYPAPDYFQHVIRQHAPDGTVTVSGDLPFDFSGYDKQNDNQHASPSVGVDRDGFIHVTGSMHLSSWQMLKSDAPYDVSAFSEVASLPDVSSPTYAEFFNDSRTGQLFLFCRGWFNSNQVWRNGGRSGYFFKYDEAAGTWTPVGAAVGSVSNPIYDQTSDATTLTDGVWTLPLSSTETNEWVVLAADSGGVYQRFYRYPEGDANEGERIDPNWDISTGVFGYERYQFKFLSASDGWIYLAWTLNTDPEWLGDTSDVTLSHGGTDYTWGGEEFIKNYANGRAILIVRTRDSGATWETVNGESVTPPFSATNLTKANGGQAFFSANKYEVGEIDLPSLYLFEDMGEPSVRFVFTDQNGVDSQRVFRWSGGAWSEKSSEIWSGMPGDATIPQSIGDSVLVGFEGESSRGSNIRYKINGRWDYVESPPKTRGYAWSNGLRVDLSAIHEGLFRYVLSEYTNPIGSKTVSGRVHSGFSLGANFYLNKTACDYADRVEAADGQRLPDEVRAAMIELEENLEPIIHLIGEMRLLRGPRTLAGALLAFRGHEHINNNGFTDADYDPSLGLTGDGVDKHLVTGFSGRANTIGSESMWAYLAAFPGSGTQGIMGNTLNESGSSNLTLRFDGGSLNRRSAASQCGANDTINSTPDFVPGIYGANRTRLSEFNIFGPDPADDNIRTVDAQPPSTKPFMIYRRAFGGNSLFSDSTLAAYGIGKGIGDLSILRNALDTYMSKV